MPGTGNSSACPASRQGQGRARRRPRAAHSSGSASATCTPVCAPEVADSPTATGIGYSVLPFPARWLHNATRNGSSSATDLRREPGARNAALIHTTIAELAPVHRLPAAVLILTVRPTHSTATRVRHAAHRPNTILATPSAGPGSLDTAATSRKRPRRRAIFTSRRERDATGTTKRRAIFTTRRDGADPARARRAILVPATATSRRASAGPRRVLRVPAATAAAPAGVRDVILVPAATGPARVRGVLRVAAATDGGAVELAS